jgi:RsiW-degrading membrane proteinase PrsW (M82 family)
MNEPTKWDLLWTALWGLVDVLFVVACYIFMVHAMLKKDWAAGTFWLAWLVLREVQKIREAE